MVYGKVTRVVNPSRRKKSRARNSRPKQSHRRRRSSGNPAHVLTLGFLNPKKRSKSVATKAKKRKHNKRRTSHAHRSVAHNKPRRNYGHRRHNRRNPTRRMMVVHPRHNRRHRNRRNPHFFGAQVSFGKLAEYIAGGLIGVTVNKAVLPMLPATVTSSNIFSSVAAVAIAIAEWWVGGFIDKDFGAAVGFGGLMNAGSQILNAFVPSVGTVVSLSGRRGTGDFVPGLFAVPQNPVSDANTGLAMRGGVSHAYPSAYAAA